MLELAALGLLVVAVAVALTAGLFMLKVVLWLVLLPVRLVLAVLMIPLVLLKLGLAALFFLVVAPLAGLAVVAGLVVALAMWLA